jgi:two-component system sensor histidine kinase KdpD
MSRIEGGALRLQRDWYDLGELVREVAARLRPVLNGRGVELAIPEGLPPVSIDYLLVDQVVTNLIENAAKYTPPGSPIRVSVERKGDPVRVAVAEHGPGNPADKRERIFDKFYRLQSKPGIRGSGLGLAVSRGLVEAHGGRIWAEDNPGGGARFVFELPIEPPVEHAPPVTAPPARRVAPVSRA